MCETAAYARTHRAGDQARQLLGMEVAMSEKARGEHSAPELALRGPSRCGYFVAPDGHLIHLSMRIASCRWPKLEIPTADRPTSCPIGTAEDSPSWTSPGAATAAVGAEIRARARALRAGRLEQRCPDLARRTQANHTDSTAESCRLAPEPLEDPRRAPTRMQLIRAQHVREQRCSVLWRPSSAASAREGWWATSMPPGQTLHS